MLSTWVKKRQKARAKARLWFQAGTLALYLLLVLANVTLRTLRSNLAAPSLTEGKDVAVSLDAGREKANGGGGSVGSLMRVRRDSPSSETEQSDFALPDNKININDDEDDDKDNCTPRAIHNFPGNFFTLKDTQDGGVLVHILIALYLFGALSIVCDDYFVPAMERLCQDLGLQEDVAGATFMAAGSSAPELCTSIVGVFIAQSDVGVGTIVGSAVFNILCIVGLCGLLAGMVLPLTWYPLMRDTLFYLLSVLVLVLFIRDSRVYWYEALVMLLLYIIYILLMYFNRTLENRATSALDAVKLRWRARRGYWGPVDPEEDRGLLENSGASERSGGEQETPGEAETDFSTSYKDGAETEEGQGYESPWTVPDSYLGRVFWVAMLPVKAVCYFTVPDCRRGGVWRRLYMLTFLASVVWIAAFTYVMVWVITIAGDALSIPDTVMGLTLLAAGTSIPDCLAGVLVARDGYGDMAVSNAVGSNVFDILICLGLPWLIETAFVKRGDYLEISSSGLIYSSLTLLATVVFLLVSIAVNRWRLTKAYGALCLAVYVVVITLSSLYELNVFGDLNPPACPR
ncbi:hypothetical protein ACOMHN_051443 [Nucella lapillus]